MIYIIKEQGLYQNKLNSSLEFPTVPVKWAILSVLRQPLLGSDEHWSPGRVSTTPREKQSLLLVFSFSLSGFEVFFHR